MNDSLERINTRLAILKIRNEIEEVIGYALVNDDLEDKSFLREQLKQSVSEMLNRYPIETNKVEARTAVGYQVSNGRHPKVNYILHDGGTVKCKKKFYSLRTARSHGKHSWKGMMFVDIMLKPTVPCEYVTLNYTVS